MPHAACPHCHRAYALTASRRWPLLCPRCRQVLRRLAPGEERRWSEPAAPAAALPAPAGAERPAPPDGPARAARAGQVSGRVGLLLAAGVGGLALAVFGLAFSRRPAPPPARPERLRRVGVHSQSPFGRVLWEARWYRTQAIQAVNQERALPLETLPPEESARVDREPWRRELMARDRSGDLQRARRAAEQAAALARTPAEQYEAAVWLALIESDAGHPQTELQQARRMMALQPRNELSLVALRRAAAANHLHSLEEQATTALNHLREARAARGAGRVEGKN